MNLLSSKADAEHGNTLEINSTTNWLVDECRPTQLLREIKQIENWLKRLMLSSVEEAEHFIALPRTSTLK